MMDTGRVGGWRSGATPLNVARTSIGAAGAQLRRVLPGDGQAVGVGRSERQRVAIPSVLLREMP
jgi:hypothetical protein